MTLGVSLDPRVMSLYELEAGNAVKFDVINTTYKAKSLVVLPCNKDTAALGQPQLLLALLREKMRM